MSSIRSVLLAAIAEAKSKGLPIDGTDADVVDGVDDSGRPCLFLGAVVAEDLRRRGVIFGEAPDGSGFFLDADGVTRVRCATLKVSGKAPTPPGFLGGVRPQARDPFGDVVEKPIVWNRAQRRAAMPKPKTSWVAPATLHKPPTVPPDVAIPAWARCASCQGPCRWSVLGESGRVAAARAELASLFGVRFDKTMTYDADGNGRVTGPDGLELETDKLSAVIPHPDVCPACGGPLSTTRDVVACDVCDWQAATVLFDELAEKTRGEIEGEGEG